MHPIRKDNFYKIQEQYSKYACVDEVIIITGKNVFFTDVHPKFKFVYFDGPYDYGSWPHLGLLARYIFAVSCKNRFVFMQDDDLLYTEATLKKLYKMKTPMAGLHRRWFVDNTYQSRPPRNSSKTKTAPMILTGGVMLDTYYMPDVIKLAREFFADNYQTVFNGEDIFMSRAMSHITGQDEFSFIEDRFETLPTHDVQLYKNFHNHETRAEFCKLVYDFFEEKKNDKIC